MSDTLASVACNLTPFVVMLCIVLIVKAFKT
jgi:hypothetical protein